MVTEYYIPLAKTYRERPRDQWVAWVDFRSRLLDSVQNLRLDIFLSSVRFRDWSGCNARGSDRKASRQLAQSGPTGSGCLPVHRRVRGLGSCQGLVGSGEPGTRNIKVYVTLLYVTF